MTRMTVLAVTRMAEGRACIAGVSEEGEWLRPRPQGRLLERTDLRMADGAQISAWDVLELPDGDRVPDPPHVEDIEVDWRRVRVADQVRERQRFSRLSAWAGESFEEVFDADDRSLGLVKVEGIMARRYINDSGPSVKMTFCCREAGAWCKYAALTAIEEEEMLLQEFERRDVEQLKKNDLRKLFNGSEFHLAIGLTREYKGQCWPLVVGIHSVGRWAG